MAAKSVSLLSNAAATGTAQPWPGGRTSLIFMGTVGGATIKLQVLGQDGSTFIDVQTVTAAGLTALDLPPGSYRGSVSGGAPAALYMDLAPVSYYR